MNPDHEAAAKQAEYLIEPAYENLAAAYLELHKWRNAVEEACIVNWTQFIPDDPKQTINLLMCCAAQQALDPCISEDAQKLKDTYLAENIEQARLLGMSAERELGLRARYGELLEKYQYERLK